MLHYSIVSTGGWFEVNNMSSESIILMNSIADQLQDCRKKQQEISRLQKESAVSIDMPTTAEVNNISPESVILVTSVANQLQDYRKKQQEICQSIPKNLYQHRA